VLIALYIALGGALGTMARFLTGLGLQRALGDRLPYATFAVNVLGSFIIGYTMAHFAARGALDSHVRGALTIGFLGGFTTYSSFAYETVSLLQAGRAAAAAGYVSLTLVLAGLACYGGMLLARAYAPS
jgi:CrcB protein